MDEVVEELDAILEFLLPHNPGAALDYVIGLEAACNKLGEFPQNGRRFNDLYRVLIVRNHLAFYRYDETRDTAVIAKIIHGNRDIPKLLD